MRHRFAPLVAIGAVAIGMATQAVIAHADGDCTPRCTGSFADGATYLIEVPSDWNGTLLLYSHGYVFNGQPNPARDAGDEGTARWLLDHGYALAGSSYRGTGWALEDAFDDQIQTLDEFDRRVHRHPDRTVAWGHSLGGIITAGLVQRNPERFDGALPMCGVLAGGPAAWNQGLDGAFVFKALVAPEAIYPKLTGYTAAEGPGNVAAAQALIDGAQGTPLGRARIALASAVAEVPGWFSAAQPEPAPDDFAAQEQNQYLWQRNVDFVFAFMGRSDLERRAGGNPSWNNGIDYGDQLERAPAREEVVALYRKAQETDPEASLERDLEALEAASRIRAEPRALEYLSRYIVFNGRLGGVPVLTLHTSADGLVQVEQENAYAAVAGHHASDGLAQIYVHRAGHCTFTPAETIAAFQALVERIEAGAWPELDPASLNEQAAGLGPRLNPAPPAYFRFHPAAFLRRYDARHLDD